jgi:hypothetical protein
VAFIVFARSYVGNFYARKGGLLGLTTNLKQPPGGLLTGLADK